MRLALTYLSVLLLLSGMANATIAGALESPVTAQWHGPDAHSPAPHTVHSGISSANALPAGQSVQMATAPWSRFWAEPVVQAGRLEVRRVDHPPR